MDNFRIQHNESGRSMVLSNDIDDVIITTYIGIDASTYSNKDTAVITDSFKNEIEVDAVDLRSTIEAFIELNNIK